MTEEPKRPLKVFLCHAHSDKDKVRELYLRLRKEGVDVWLDKEKLLAGSDWEYEIRKAVRASDVVVVCLSKQFNQAGFRQREVRIALDTAMEKPEGEIFIIPARLEECDNLESLSKWHWVDLFEEGGYHSLIRALRARADRIDATLRIRRGGRPTVPRPKIMTPVEENKPVVPQERSIPFKSEEKQIEPPKPKVEKPEPEKASEIKDIQKQQNENSKISMFGKIRKKPLVGWLVFAIIIVLLWGFPVKSYLANNSYVTLFDDPQIVDIKGGFIGQTGKTIYLCKYDINGKRYLIADSFWNCITGETYGWIFYNRVSDQFWNILVHKQP